MAFEQWQYLAAELSRARYLMNGDARRHRHSHLFIVIYIYIGAVTRMRFATLSRAWEQWQYVHADSQRRRFLLQGCRSHLSCRCGDSVVRSIFRSGEPHAEPHALRGVGAVAGTTSLLLLLGFTVIFLLILRCAGVVAVRGGGEEETAAAAQTRRDAHAPGELAFVFLFICVFLFLFLFGVPTLTR